MKFSYNMQEMYNSCLKHLKLGEATAELKGAIKKLTRINPDLENIGEIESFYKRTFFNHTFETARFFANFANLQTNREGICKYLYYYMRQYYNDFLVSYGIKNTNDLVDFFFKWYCKIRDLLYSCDYNNVKNNVEFINKGLSFFAIIEDFLVRLYNYSIFGVSGQKYIITSCSNCDKQFIDELADGYSLIRFKKIRLIDGSNPHYELMDIFPTKNIGFQIDEYIELSNDVKNPELIRIL